MMVECRNPACYNTFDPSLMWNGKKRTRGNKRNFCSRDCWNQYRATAAYARQYGIKTKYGISYEEYESRLRKQQGKCAICGREERTKTKGTEWHLNVDHDHNTNEVRGLLCSSCNKAIGLFGDDVLVLQRAISYLNGDI